MSDEWSTQDVAIYESLFIESLLSCLDGYKPIYHNVDETDISLFI